MHLSYRRFFRFFLRQDHYQFRILPFELDMVPRVFYRNLFQWLQLE